jgi:hypothetical protein
MLRQSLVPSRGCEHFPGSQHWSLIALPDGDLVCHSFSDDPVLPTDAKVLSNGAGISVVRIASADEFIDLGSFVGEIVLWFCAA